ncbi:MAG: hypothetical protein HY287_10225 [Planctomycetes bacterium]|nr:hypothetical protein [Planctomycetota bacterium]MBI3834692.1 hypothetical protein [Planctomycetota bacterium]
MNPRPRMPPDNDSIDPQDAEYQSAYHQPVPGQRDYLEGQATNWIGRIGFQFCRILPSWFFYLSGW